MTIQKVGGAVSPIGGALPSGIEINPTKTSFDIADVVDIELGATYVVNMTTRNNAATAQLNTSTVESIRIEISSICPLAPVARNVTPVTTDTTRQLTFHWEGIPDEDDGGSDITGYQVEYWQLLEGREIDNTKKTLGPTERSFILTVDRPAEGEDSELWQFRVRGITLACGVNNDKAIWSAIRAGEVPAIAADDECGLIESSPGPARNPVTNKLPTALSPNRIRLGWSSVDLTEYPENDCRSAVTNYRVRYSDDNGATWLNPGGVDGDDVGLITQKFYSTLPPGKDILFEIIAENATGVTLNAQGNEDWVSTTLTGVVSALCPSAPTITDVTKDDNEQVTVTWTKSADDGGSTITGHLLELIIVDGDQTEPHTINIGVSGSGSRQLSTGYVGGTWTVRLKPVSGAACVDTDNWSNSVSIDVLTPPSKPENPALDVNSSNNGFVFTWASPMFMGMLDLDNYNVRYKITRGDTVLSQGTKKVSADVKEFDTTDLTTTTPFGNIPIVLRTGDKGEFEVQGENAKGTGGWTDKITGEIPQPKPGKPSVASSSQDTTVVDSSTDLTIRAPTVAIKFNPSSIGAPFTRNTFEVEINGEKQTFTDDDTSNLVMNVVAPYYSTTRVRMKHENNAEEDNGDGPFSDWSDSVVVPGPGLNHPTNFRAVRKVASRPSERGYDISWDAPIQDSRAPTTGYICFGVKQDPTRIILGFAAAIVAATGVGLLAGSVGIIINVGAAGLFAVPTAGTTALTFTALAGGNITLLLSSTTIGATLVSAGALTGVAAVLTRDLNEIRESDDTADTGISASRSRSVFTNLIIDKWIVIPINTFGPSEATEF